MPEFDRLKQDKVNFDEFNLRGKHIDDLEKQYRHYQFTVNFSLAEDKQNNRAMIQQDKKKYEQRLQELRTKQN